MVKIICFLILLLPTQALSGTCYSDSDVVVIGDSTAYGMVRFAMDSQTRGKFISIPSGWKSFKYPSYSRHPVFGGASSKYVLNASRSFDFRFAKNAIISVGYNDLSIDRDKDGKETVDNIVEIVKLLRLHGVPRIKIIMPFTNSRRQAKKRFKNEANLLSSIRTRLKTLSQRDSSLTIIYHDKQRAQDGLHLSVKGYKELYKRATEC